MKEKTISHNAMMFLQFSAFVNTGFFFSEYLSKGLYKYEGLSEN
jgi:hypothetical protein